MSAGVLLVVLFGAALHATWNLLLAGAPDKRLATAGLYASAGLIAAVALPFLPAPARASWPYLAASTAFELLYGVLLAAAYRAGDLSRTYPVMRGTAPVLVALAGALLLGDRLSLPLCAGIALVSAGILSLLFERGGSLGSARAVQLAILNAAVIATYTSIDGLGVRRSQHPLSYSLCLFVTVGLAWLLTLLARGDLRAGSLLLRTVPRAALGGICALASYSAALWAMTHAPIAAVAAARETSIVFGTLLGALVLRERVTPARAVAAVVITVGVILIRAG